MRTMIYSLVLAIALPVASTGAQTVKQETQELRAAKQELKRDQRDRRQAVRRDDTTAVKQEAREVRADKRDVHQERRDVKRAVVTKKRG
jgi:uncharacterized protein HemX